VAELLAWKSPPTPMKGCLLGVRLDFDRAAVLHCRTNNCENLLDTPAASSGTHKEDTNRVRPRVLMCHDMKGGYNFDADDRYLRAFSRGAGGGEISVRGCGSWASVDEVCYFSHHFVTVPPRCWIDAAHSNGKLIFGTLITEHDPVENTRLLDSTDHCTTQLANMCAHYSFDGWLVNIEAPLPGGCVDVARLAHFIALLRSKCRTARRFPQQSTTEAAVALQTSVSAVDENTNGSIGFRSSDSKVLVYDSVGADGSVRYACGLTAATTLPSPAAAATTHHHANAILLSAADGLLLDYHWTSQGLDLTRRIADTLPPRSDVSSFSAPRVAETQAAIAETQADGRDEQVAGRRCDVYVGVDIFGRGTCHGPGFDACHGVEEAARCGLSVGIFAPGWTLETGARIPPASCPPPLAGPELLLNSQISLAPPELEDPESDPVVFSHDATSASLAVASSSLNENTGDQRRVEKSIPPGEEALSTGDLEDSEVDAAFWRTMDTGRVWSSL